MRYFFLLAGAGIYGITRITQILFSVLIHSVCFFLKVHVQSFHFADVSRIAVRLAENAFCILSNLVHHNFCRCQFHAFLFVDQKASINVQIMIL